MQKTHLADQIGSIQVTYFHIQGPIAYVTQLLLCSLTADKFPHCRPIHSGHPQQHVTRGDWKGILCQSCIRRAPGKGNSAKPRLKLELTLVSKNCHPSQRKPVYVATISWMGNQKTMHMKETVPTSNSTSAQKIYNYKAVISQVHCFGLCFAQWIPRW